MSCMESADYMCTVLGCLFFLILQAKVEVLKIFVLYYQVQSQNFLFVILCTAVSLSLFSA